MELKYLALGAKIFIGIYLSIFLRFVSVEDKHKFKWLFVVFNVLAGGFIIFTAVYAFISGEAKSKTENMFREYASDKLSELGYGMYGVGHNLKELSDSEDKKSNPFMHHDYQLNIALKLDDINQNIASSFNRFLTMAIRT
ncbi:MAG: hypothetical protein A3C36_01665 [Omnitrophica WOR_2 bacterium RIFCSPHIGHO2_02_FULL_52_10]|nr:MAG: hypothetical protein A3C36_01665 [Omnitrophica WOR_2 bacterium RIFCSPHIGHO2_02_FULL_52_10]